MWDVNIHGSILGSLFYFFFDLFSSLADLGMSSSLIGRMMMFFWKSEEDSFIV